MIVLGDTHSVKEVSNLLECRKIKNKNIIHVGDFGIGFSILEKDLNSLYELNAWLLFNNNTLYVIRGNHDSPEFFNGKINLPIYSNLKLVSDYSILEIEGFNVLFIGGAISIDRILRRQGKNYWVNEKFEYDEEKLEGLLFKTGKIDIVITHTCPEFCFPRGTNAKIVNYYCKLDNTLRDELIIERIELARAYQIIKQFNPFGWFYGHFHMSKDENIDGIRFKLLDIKEMIEI